MNDTFKEQINQDEPLTIDNMLNHLTTNEKKVSY